MASWSVIFGQKGLFLYLAEPDGTSWSRPGRDLAPKTLQGRSFIDLGWFLELQRVDFGTSRDGFSAFRGDQGNEFQHAAPIDTLRSTDNESMHHYQSDRLAGRRADLHFDS